MGTVWFFILLPGFILLVFMYKSVDEAVRLLKDKEK